MLMLSTLSVTAQDCDGLPCGAIPWALPDFPILASPTLYPTVAITATPTPTFTPTAATPTPTATLDISDIIGGLENLNELLTGTAQVINGIGGTPVMVGTAAYGDYQDNAQLAISYVKAVGAADFGVVTPLVQFFVGSMLFVLSVKLVEISVPFIGVLFGALRKLVQVVMDFIPL